MRMRKEKINYREAENYEREVEHAELRSAGSTPGRRPRQEQIRRIEDEDENRRQVFEVEIRHCALQTIYPDKTHRCANHDRDEPDDYAALAHSLQQFEGRQSPDYGAHVAAAEQVLLGEEDEAKDEGKSKRRVGEDAER